MELSAVSRKSFILDVLLDSEYAYENASVKKILLSLTITLVHWSCFIHQIILFFSVLMTCTFGNNINPPLANFHVNLSKLRTHNKQMHYINIRYRCGCRGNLSPTKYGRASIILPTLSIDWCVFIAFSANLKFYQTF